MKNIKMIVLVLLLVLAFILAPAVKASQVVSEEYLKEARECSSLEQGKKLIVKYEKLKDSNPYKYLYLGILYHNLANPQEEELLKKALEFTRKAVEKTNDPLASGYYGSALTIQAGAFFKKGDMMGAMSKLEEGIGIMDKAVEQGPGNIDLRVLRILNSHILSNASPLNRFDKIKEDLAFLKQGYKKLSPQMKSFYNLYSGLTALEDNDRHQAVVFFENAIASAPRSRYAKMAQNRLNQLEQ